MNSVNLIGNIATDIDLTATSTGKYVAKFNLAVKRPFSDATDFLPVEVWNKQGENTAQYCQKGSKVAVSGAIVVDQWEKDGQKRSRTKINANTVEFLDSKGDKSMKQGNTQEKDTSNVDPFENQGEPADIQDSDLPF